MGCHLSNVHTVRAPVRMRRRGDFVNIQSLCLKQIHSPMFRVLTAVYSSILSPTKAKNVNCVPSHSGPFNIIILLLSTGAHTYEVVFVES